MKIIEFSYDFHENDYPVSNSTEMAWVAGRGSYRSSHRSPPRDCDVGWLRASEQAKQSHMIESAADPSEYFRMF